MGHREFRFGDWQVDVEGNTLSDGAVRIALEPRAMEVLRYLCRHPGAVIPAEELLQACWGSAEFGDNPVHKAITQLRRALGDSSTEPRYIETIRKRGYRAIAQVIEAEEDEEIVWTSGSPFRGLESFQENHAAIFFGRVQATARLKEVAEKQTLAGQAMVLVLGPSGSGKTSLVRAGLIPQLMQSVGGESNPISLSCTLYLDCADIGESSLFSALAAVLIDAEFNDVSLFPNESADSLGKKLENFDLNEILGPTTLHKPVIGLFVDRLEAIFRAKDLNNDGRERFISLLDELAKKKGILVILACRNDFYPEIISLQKLRTLKANGGHFDLNTPDGADIAQIIRMPAKAAKLCYEIDSQSGASLDDILCDASRGSPDTLPLLQYCLNELYRQRTEDGTLLLEVYRRLGGIEGAIGIRAEQIITGLKPTQAAALPQILSLLVKIGDEQSAVTARSVAWSLLRNDDERDLVRAMVEARLFVSELAGEIPSFGVAHEALLRRWPRVTSWIELHQSSLQLRTRLSGQVTRWIAAGRPRDLLLPRGLQITQARTLLNLPGFALSAAEREFIQTSAARAKLSDRMRFAILATMIILALAAILLGFFAKASQREAEKHRTEAEGLLIFMLGDFVDRLRPLGRLDILDSVSSRALTYLSKNSVSQTTNEIELSQRAKALQILAEVNVARSRIPEAIESLQAGRAILTQQLAKSPQDKALLKSFGANAFWLGQIYFDQREFDLAINYLSEYRDFSKRIIKVDESDLDGIIELSYANNSLGSVYLRKNDLQAAAQYFDASMKLKSKAFKIRPNDEALVMGYANSLSWLASTRTKLGMLKDAVDLFNREVELLRPIHNGQKKNTLASQRLGVALLNLAEITLALGENSKAEQIYMEAKALLEELTQTDTTNRVWQMNYYIAQLNISRLQNIVSSDKSLQKSTALYENLSALSSLDPKREELTRFVSRAQADRAMLYLRLKKLSLAQQDIDESLSRLEKLNNRPNAYDQRILGLLAQTMIHKAEIHFEKNEYETAKEVCEKAAIILKPAMDTTEDFRLLSPFIQSQACIGNIQKAAPHISKLNNMSFQDSAHFEYISTHPRKKGN